jgi:Fe-S cluster assembly ATPase SufC
MDWEDNELDFSDGDILDIVDELKKLDCNIVTHRNPIPNDITYSGMAHGEIIKEIDNSLVHMFEKLAGTCFSDYAGIKKDKIGRVRDHNCTFCN